MYRPVPPAARAGSTVHVATPRARRARAARGDPAGGRLRPKNRPFAAPGKRHGTRSGHALRNLLRSRHKPISGGFRLSGARTGEAARPRTRARMAGAPAAASESKRFPKAKVDREGTVQLQAALYIVRIPSATRHANHHVTPMRSASIAPTVIGCSVSVCPHHICDCVPRRSLRARASTSAGGGHLAWLLRASSSVPARITRRRPRAVRSGARAAPWAASRRRERRPLRPRPPRQPRPRPRGRRAPPDRASSPLLLWRRRRRRR